MVAVLQPMVVYSFVTVFYLSYNLLNGCSPPTNGSGQFSNSVLPELQPPEWLQSSNQWLWTVFLTQHRSRWKISGISWNEPRMWFYFLVFQVFNLGKTGEIWRIFEGKSLVKKKLLKKLLRKVIFIF